MKVKSSSCFVIRRFAACLFFVRVLSHVNINSTHTHKHTYIKTYTYHVYSETLKAFNHRSGYKQTQWQTNTQQQQKYNKIKNKQIKKNKSTTTLIVIDNIINKLNIFKSARVCVCVCVDLGVLYVRYSIV